MSDFCTSIESSSLCVFVSLTKIHITADCVRKEAIKKSITRNINLLLLNYFAQSLCCIYKLHSTFKSSWHYFIAFIPIANAQTICTTLSKTAAKVMHLGSWRQCIRCACIACNVATHIRHDFILIQPKKVNWWFKFINEQNMNTNKTKKKRSE